MANCWGVRDHSFIGETGVLIVDVGMEHTISRKTVLFAEWG